MNANQEEINRALIKHGYKSAQDERPKVDGQECLVYNGALIPIHAAVFERRFMGNCWQYGWYATDQYNRCYLGVTYWKPMPKSEGGDNE